MISVVLLLSRPDRLGVMFDQYESQSQREHSDQPTRLVVVESAGAIGACQAQGRPPALVAVSATPHSGAARNAGLAAVNAAGGDIVCFWDDDDWYGPQYVREAVQALEHSGATVVGKQWHYVDYESKYLFRFNEQHSATAARRSVIGPTITVRAGDALPFESRYLDDCLWCDAMRRRGATFHSTSMQHYVHRRHSGNYTGHYSVEYLVYTLGEGSYLGAPDYAVASGEREAVAVKAVRPHALWEEPAAA